MCVCVHHGKYPWRPREGISLPWIRNDGHLWAAGSQIWVLCKGKTQTLRSLTLDQECFKPNSFMNSGGLEIFTNDCQCMQKRIIMKCYPKDQVLAWIQWKILWKFLQVCTLVGYVLPYRTPGLQKDCIDNKDNGQFLGT